MPQPFALSLRRSRRSAAALVAGIAALLAGSGAARAGSPITVQSGVVATIDAANRVCTAEPRSIVYGTGNYDSGRPLSYSSDGVPGPGYYVPANAPSAIDLVPAVLAGARSDLCAAFTLPADVEAPIIRTLATPGDRLQDDPAWPDIPETHVVPEVPGDPAPEGDDARSLTIDLPLGQGIAFAPQTTCTDAQFGTATYADAACPAASQIGDGLVRLGVWDGTAAHHLPLPTAKLYLLPHGADEVARVGLAVRPLPALAPLKFVLRATLRPTGQIRLVASDLPRELYRAADVTPSGALSGGATALPTYLESLGLRLWGANASHATLAADLAASTTDCSSAATGTIAVSTYGGAASTTSPATLAASGCSGLAYTPAASIDVDTSGAGAPAQATISLALGGGATGRLPAGTAGAAITLPSSLALGAQIAAHDLTFCSAAEFDATSSAPATCAATSAIGTAALRSSVSTDPLLGTLRLGAPTTSGDLASLLVELAPSGATTADAPRLKFTGRLLLSDGRVTLRFAALPALPITTLDLSLRGGDDAVLTAAPACDVDQTVAVEFTSVGGLTSTAHTGDAVDEPGDCEGTAALGVAATAVSPTAGARDGLTLHLTRPAGASPLTSVGATLPPGALLDLRGAAECDPGAASRGGCPDGSSLGSITLSAGAGPAPLRLTGTLERIPASPGTLAAGIAYLPVRLGAIDLGAVTVPVAIGYDATARTVAMAATVPTSVGGLDLDVRDLQVSIAQGIAVNPTACGALPLSGDATTSGGGGAHATGALTIGGCDAQALAPGLKATLSGESAVGGHPKATISLQPRSGDANLGAMSLTLPAGLEIDATRATCDAATFTAGRCGTTGRVGGLAVGTGVQSELIGGDVHLVAAPGRALPQLGITVGGTYGFRALGDLSIADGRVQATFASLPDLPLTRLDLVFDGGAGGALRIARSPCGSGGDWRAAFTGQGGQRSSASAALGCTATGAPAATATGGPVVELSVKGKTGLKLKINGFGGRRLQAAKLTLSPRMRFVTSAARRPRNTAIAVIGPKAATSFSSTSLTLQLGAGSAPQEVVARVRWPAMVLSAKGHRKSTFRLRLAFADGTVQTRDVLVTLPS